MAWVHSLPTLKIRFDRKIWTSGFSGKIQRFLPYAILQQQSAWLSKLPPRPCRPIMWPNARFCRKPLHAHPGGFPHPLVPVRASLSHTGTDAEALHTNAPRGSWSLSPALHTRRKGSAP